MPSTLKAVYPGSFDPPTLGHLDIIRRARKIFGDLTVLIAKSSKKTPLFSTQERKTLLEECLSDDKNVKVEIHDGLTVDYMKKQKAQVIIRGLRAVSDFENELQIAIMNRKLQPDIETLIIMAGEEFFYISSNIVKEVATHGGDVSKVVPATVAKAITEKLKEKE